MSVLIEETTLVAVRSDFEAHHPGGAAAFIAAASTGIPPRFTCDGDPHLISLGYHDAGHAQQGARLLENTLYRWVLVNADYGPHVPVEWMKFSSRGGVARAWLAGKRAGKVAEITAGKETLRLAVEDGVETYLDLATGAQFHAEVSVPTATASDAVTTPVHDSLIAAIDMIGWDHYQSAAPSAIVNLLGDTGLYSNKFFANEIAAMVVCFTRAPLLVPTAARRRAMEFITRANYGMQVGGFELSLDEGVLGFRTTAPAIGGVVAETDVRNLAAHNINTLDRYIPFLMEVVYGKRNVRDAVDEAERS